MKPFLGILAAAAISAAACTSAAAQSYPGEYFAAVDANGDTVRSSGAFGSTRTATGTYNVVFTRDSLIACAFIGGLSGPNPGQIAVQGGNANKLTVRTFSKTGAAANRAFHVIVLCAPGATPN